MLCSVHFQVPMDETRVPATIFLSIFEYSYGTFSPNELARLCCVYFESTGPPRAKLATRILFARREANHTKLGWPIAVISSGLLHMDAIASFVLS